MKFLQYDLGQLKKGQIVEVSLSSQANVKLMSSTDFNNTAVNSVEKIADEIADEIADLINSQKGV